MTLKKIALLPGDGIGKEVTHVSLQILHRIGQTYGHTFQVDEALIGHAAILATGDPLPQATIDVCHSADAILLGAVGDPLYDHDPSLKVRPEQGLLKLRKTFDLFANIRPIKLFDQLIHASSLKEEVLRGADIVFFRELTSGIYFGTPRERQDNGDTAIDTMRYTRHEVRRIAQKAFQAAQNRRKKLCSVDKANVLESSRLWREVVQGMASEFPDVEVTHMFIDNASMQLIRNPRQFDVILTGNMFGDILTDEASQIAGSMGMLPSASVGERIGLYEPIHGSAPDIAGQDIANPLASVLSVGMMLDLSFGLHAESQAVVQAVARFLAEGYRTRDIAQADTPAQKILRTSQVAAVLERFL